MTAKKLNKKKKRRTRNRPLKNLKKSPKKSFRKKLGDIKISKSSSNATASKEIMGK